MFRSLAFFPARPLLVCTDRRLAHAILSLLLDIFTTRRVWPNSSKTAQTETGNLAGHCGLLRSFSHSFDWTTLTTTTKWMYQRIVFNTNYSMSHSQESLTLTSIETKCKAFLMKNWFIGMRIKKTLTFSYRCYALSLSLKQRLGVTQLRIENTIAAGRESFVDWLLWSWGCSLTIECNLKR